MIEFVLPVLVVSCIGAGLALLLVLCEKYVVNYGSCKVTLNEDRELEVDGGKPLLTVLREKQIFIPSACGGRGTCGVCKLKITEGAGPVLPTEAPLLTKEELADNVRLSCQVKVRNDLRLILPESLLSIREYDTVCVRIEELTYDMRRFRFELKDPPEITFTPGQFVQLLCPRYKGSSEEVYRAYSIASDPTANGVVDLIIRRVPAGICTTWCFDYLKEGDNVRLNGPYGEFRLSDTQAPMVFVAGGSGMAPFVSLLHHMRNTASPRQARYFFGGNTVRDLCLQDEMQQFEQSLADFRFVPVVANPQPEDHWTGETGLVTHAVKRHYETLSDHEGYLCGSPGMIEAASKVFVEMGMDPAKIYYDKFA